MKPAAVDAQKTAPIALPTNASQSSTPTQAISIKPFKRKLKKKIPADSSSKTFKKQQDEEQRRQQQLLEQRRQQLLQEAERQRVIAETEAKRAANEAVNALKQSLRENAVASSTNTAHRPSGGNTGGAASSLEAQYFSRIFSHLHQYWSLPDIKPWSPTITAVVVVNFSKTGRIISHNFEKHSGDKVFDRFVSRTIQDANPLPAIPAALKKNQYTIGLRFRPGGIQ